MFKSELNRGRRWIVLNLKEQCHSGFLKKHVDSHIMNELELKIANRPLIEEYNFFLKTLGTRP